MDVKWLGQLDDELFALARHDDIRLTAEPSVAVLDGGADPAGGQTRGTDSLPEGFDLKTMKHDRSCCNEYKRLENYAPRLFLSHFSPIDPLS
ncbi:hypothetical protein G8C92_27770 [Paenibacillus donghaensis]|uniref:hypothetical protein n=1 Tax=Paenibacillus donghaensis TaxID=414771 RepID=UPI0018834216|nr:hypothetical protein [Paenibacillus donghaensis]MBE9917804.1 hypothetical protein [Paenibacillus donghaensis]